MTIRRAVSELLSDYLRWEHACTDVNHDQLDAGRKTRDKIRQLEKLNPRRTVTLTALRPDAQLRRTRRAGTRRLTTVRIPVTRMA